MDHWKSTRDVYISQPIKTADQLLKLLTALKKDHSGAEPSNGTLGGGTEQSDNVNLTAYHGNSTIDNAASPVDGSTVDNNTTTGEETDPTGGSNQGTNEQTRDEQRLTKYKKVLYPSSCLL